jgi:PAS domain S-box-containing protein
MFSIDHLTESFAHFNIPHGIVITDQNGQIVSVNEHISRWLNKSTQELTGRPIDEMIQAKIKINSIFETARFLELTQFPVNQPLILLLQSSQDKNPQYLLRIETLQNNDKKQIIFTFIPQITSVDFLETSRMLLEHIPDAFFHGDENGNFIYANKAAEKLTGYSRKELLAMKMEDLFPVDTLQKNPLRYDQLKSGKTVIKIRKMLRKDGTTIHVEMHSRINKDGSYQSVMRDIENRISMEKPLKKSEQKYRNLFEKSPDAILIIEDGIFVDCNQATVQMLGYNNKEDLLDTHPAELSPEYQPDGERSFVKANKMMGIAIQQGSHRFEWYHKKADGTVFPVEVSLTFISQDEQKEILHTVWKDITTRKKDELIKSALYHFTRQTLMAKKLTDIYHAFFESLNLVFSVDLFYIALFSKDLPHLQLQYTECSLPEIDYKILNENSLEELVFSSNRSLLFTHEELEELIREGTIDNPFLELPNFWIGIPIYFSAAEQGILSLAGFTSKQYRFPADLNIIEPFVNQLIISVQNISSRNSLFESETKFRSIFEESPIGIFHFDRNGVITDCNKKFVEIIGSSRETLIGFHLFDRLKNSELKKAIQQTLSEGTAYYEDYYESVTAVKKSYVRIFLKGLADKAGNIISGIGMIEDYTETKRLENQLFQAQKMEAIGKLAGGIAHDFNNILTVINGYAEMLLLKEKHNSKNYNKIRQIYQAGEKAAALTQQLLAFSRKQVLNPRLINVNQLIENMADMIQRLIGEDILLHIKLYDTNAYIFADPIQIEQIILNLAANSRDALPDGGNFTIQTDIIEVKNEKNRINPEMKNGKYVKLTLSDDGIGMDEETRNRVFEPFFTTKKQGKGTGLGLATVYGIVTQSKGFIGLQSELDRGTTFSIFFPLQKGSETDEESYSHDRQNPKGNELILIVEDESMVRNLVEQTLSEYGYQTITANGGRQALELLKMLDRQPDLILTDVTMPEMSGKEMAKIIKTKYPEIKICFMSGYSDSLITRKKLTDLGSGFIQKPFSVEILLSTIRNILDGNVPD